MADLIAQLTLPDGQYEDAAYFLDRRFISREPDGERRAKAVRGLISTSREAERLRILASLGFTGEGLNDVCREVGRLLASHAKRTKGRHRASDTGGRPKGSGRKDSASTEVAIALLALDESTSFARAASDAVLIRAGRVPSPKERDAIGETAVDEVDASLFREARRVLGRLRQNVDLAANIADDRRLARLPDGALIQVQHVLSVSGFSLAPVERDKLQGMLNRVAEAATLDDRAPELLAVVSALQRLHLDGVARNQLQEIERPLLFRIALRQGVAAL